MRSLPSPLLVPLAWLVALLLLSCRPPLGPVTRLAPPEPAATTTTTTPTPAPISLTASDGTGLVLASVRARAVLEEPVALTELELAFQSPRSERMEGRFEILLPPGARVTRFATFGAEGWREAEVVGKQEAREVYETFLLEDRDPAILERDTGNRFRGRVFPIEPHQRVYVRVSYVEALADPQQPYRLSLQGLPWLERLDADVLVLDPDGRPPREVKRHESRQVPGHDLVSTRDALPHDGVRQGEHVLARVSPLLGVDPGEPTSLQRLTVLVDTSASRALDHEASLTALGQVLRALARHAGTAHLQVLAFDQEVVPIYQGPLLGFGASDLATLRARRPLGASDLGRALRTLEDGEHQRVLLASDGLISAGEHSDAALRRQLSALAASGVERLDALVLGSVRDEPRLQRLVAGPLPRSGVLVDPVQLSPERAAERLIQPTFDGLRVEVPGARWWSPTRLDGLQPGDAVMVYAELPESQPLRVQVSGPVHHETEVPLRRSSSPLVAHEWRQGQIEGLVTRMAALQDALESERLRRHVVELSVRHRIFNDFTAFLVLERDEDYARFGLDRRALAEILVVGDDGVEVVDRTIPDEPEPDSEPGPEPEPAPAMATNAAAISGVVRDSTSKQPIASALVVLQCTCLSGTREAQTDHRGVYSFRELPPGTYTIQVLTGQADVSKVTTLPAGAKFRANFSVDPNDEFRRMIRVDASPAARREGRRERRRERWSRDRNVDGDAVYDFDDSPPPPPPATAPTFGPPPVLAPPADEGPIDPEPVTEEPIPEAKPEPITEATASHTVVTEEFRNIPVGSSSSRDFTQVLEAEPTVSYGTAGISLAGTTGAESKYVVEGASVSAPGPSRDVDADVHLRNLRVNGRGLHRRARQAARAQLEPIERCYFQTLAYHSWRLRGRLAVKLRTDAEGRVVLAGKRGQIELDSPELLRCLESALLEWRLPAWNASVTFTLVFHRNDGPPYDVPLDDPFASTEPKSPAEAFTEVSTTIAHGDPRQALPLAVAWREADPVDVLALVALGDAAWARGDLRQAARAYGSILDLYPSRADMRRFAAANLEALDDPEALALAVDAYEHALAQRPDHPSGHRNLAYALLRQGRPEQAFEVLQRALRRPFHPRFTEVHRVLADDLGIVAAAWRRLEPTRSGTIRERLAAEGVAMATEPTLRVTLSWETDANDVDLHVSAGTRGHAFSQSPSIEGGGLLADANAGFGPEHAIVPLAPDAFPCRITVHYYDRGPMGHGLGKVQLLHHDGEGRVRVVDRPFVATEDDAWIPIEILGPESHQQWPELGPPPPSRTPAPLGVPILAGNPTTTF